MNPVVHFQMPAEDKKRMAKFYEHAFDWKTRQLGPEMGEYIVVTTTESDENGRPKNVGAINGGFFQKTDDPAAQGTSIVISVDDVREAMKQVAAAGGKIIGGMQKPGEPDDIPGVGLFAWFIDSEGNHVGILQPASGSSPRR